MKWGNTTKIDWLMSTERDCGTHSNGTRYRFLLCSTPRCGSNLVSDMLHQTGMAGDPMEYLNPRYIAGYQRSRGLAPAVGVKLNNYLAEMERRRSTKNGYFGIKMHYEHLQKILGNSPKRVESFLRRFDAIVMLRRRDKVAQAVSLHRARVTQIWSSLDYKFLEPEDERRFRKVDFNPIAIGCALKEILEQDFGWKLLLTEHRLSYHEVWYEDMENDYLNTSVNLINFLNLSSAHHALKAPSIQKQGIQSDPMIEAFLEVLGKV